VLKPWGSALSSLPSHSLCLHQFAISHYCEKVRWALDFKGIAHRTNSMVPGLHRKPAKALSGRTAVPILETSAGVGLSGSSDIITWLDEHYPENVLTPSDPAMAVAACDWERFVDNELGAHVRRVCYGTLLDHKSMTVALMGHGTPWYGKPVLRIVFPKLRKLMQQHFKINPTEVLASQQAIEHVVEKLENARQANGFLVGEQFSRADLAAASLLAPLTYEVEYGVPWPSPEPEPLASFTRQLQQRLSWVSELYATYRKPFSVQRELS